MPELSSSTQQSQPKILQELVEAGKKAFEPSQDASSRYAGLQEYNELLKRTQTWMLLPALNTLIKPNVLPEWLRQPLMQTLTLLPLRTDGVRATMEFVFSIHPSNATRVVDTPQKQGASITHESVAVATKLLSSVPASMNPLEWFRGLSGQLFQLMDETDGPDLARTAAQIVGFGILGKKQLGAPGAPGWVALVQPLIQDVNPSLKSKSRPEHKEVDDTEVIDLSRDHVLVTQQALERSIRRLKVLILSNPSPGLCKRVLRPVLLQIWALASWTNLPPIADESHKAARALLQTYLRLFGNSDTVFVIIQNLLCKGSVPNSDVAWKYCLGPQGGIEIMAKGATGDNDNWAEIEEKGETLVDILVSSVEDVSLVFLDLLRRWISTLGCSTSITTATDVLKTEASSPNENLIEVAILHKLLEKAPEKLIGQFDQLLELVCHVLKADGQSTLEDDLIVIVLSLLNLVFTAPTFNKSDINPDDLSIVEGSLDRLSKEERPDVSRTAANLAFLLKYRRELDKDHESTSAPSIRLVEDRKAYNLAMNYVTGADNPPPVVSEGINLLSGLINTGSSMLDITAVTVLMSNLLQNSEDYINLRVVKVFTQLANKHPKSTIKELLDHYLDAHEKATTDVRLRFGEALLQVIERLGDTFTGETARQVSETLLSIAGRRGYRPKTKAKQAREKRLQRLKNKGDDDDNVDEADDRTEEEMARDDILAHIIQGWDSNRGAEDVRMRTSALSILGTALETNISGVGASLVSTGVDLCISILTLEPEMENAILRRAAILFTLAFVKALQNANDSGRSLGFGLTDGSREDISRTLQYVAATDSDGLVQQHAQDVIESLENWQMASLIVPQREAGNSGLERLAGLNINARGNLFDTLGRPRPRIEEVE